LSNHEQPTINRASLGNRSFTAAAPHLLQCVYKTTYFSMYVMLNLFSLNKSSSFTEDAPVLSKTASSSDCWF